MKNNISVPYDEWITNADGPIALRLKQQLLPVEESRIIFPPTYADIGYNIDILSDGTRVATIDSVGSQANRLEPIFKSDSRNPEEWLVPQIHIVLGHRPCGICEGCKRSEKSATRKGRSQGCERPHEITRSILDLAHRAADAAVRCSPELQGMIEQAFSSLQHGDAGPLCTIAPTSILFGVWNSRGDAGEKRPRLIRSIIRAWDIEPLHAAAQFNSVKKMLDRSMQQVLEEAVKGDKKKKLSSVGLDDAPATFRKVSNDAAKHMKEFSGGSPNQERRILGGVLARGRIEREVIVNLVALRGLRGIETDGADTTAIRRYLLGLALVAATHDTELFLREGCLLQYAEEGDHWFEVPRRGEPRRIDLTAERAMKYAREAAPYFQSKWPQTFRDRWPADPAKRPELRFKFDLEEAKRRATDAVPEEPSEV